VRRLGVDFGGTKIEAAILDDDDHFLARVRAPNPGAYASAIATVRDLIAQAEANAGAARPTVGFAIPGSISPATGRMRGANSTWLNDKPFAEDLSAALGRPVILENDANCFALSEAACERPGVTLFGVILGTGCGGGLVVDGKLVSGRNRFAGEWGHSPLPWPTAAERGSRACWCGKPDCLEAFVSGPALEAEYAARTGERLSATDILAGEAPEAALHADRLGRALAVACNLIDPDVIVLGGGLSRAESLYAPTLEAMRRWVFSDAFETRLRPPVHGDSSGVRGAAWLVQPND